MHICSICLKCYDDSVSICTVKDHGSLTVARKGNCRIVEGYRIDSRFESASPVELFKATHLASGKSVLIRFVDDDGSSELQAELELITGLEHSGIARTFESGCLDEYGSYIVSEYPEGQTLEEYLSDSATLPERLAIKIARRMAEGLEALHNSGLTHRAICPANIVLLLTDEERPLVKLINPDLAGLAQKTIVSNAKGVGGNSRLFRYYSPEQFNGTPDFRSDIYSLAVVLYEMLLGRSPYDGLDVQAILDYRFNESDLKELSIDLRALLAYTLQQSFQPRLDLRPPSSNYFVRQLRHIEQIADRVDNIATGQSPTSEPVEKADGRVQLTMLRGVDARIDAEPRSADVDPATSIQNDQRSAAGATESQIPAAESAGLERAKAPRVTDGPSKQEESLVPVVSQEDAFRGEALQNRLEVTDYIDGVSSANRPESLHGGSSIMSYISSIAAGLRFRMPPEGRTVFYFAGIIVSAVFGGLMTAGILSWNSAPVSSASSKVTEKKKTPPEKIVPGNRLAKKNRPSIADARKEDDMSAEEQASVSLPQGPYGQVSLRGKPRIRSAKAKKKYTSNKRKVRRRGKRSKKPAAKPTGGATRPRIVEKVVIYY